MMWSHERALRSFDAKIDKQPNGCWIWRACTSGPQRSAYGHIRALGESRAHRVSWRLFKGDIPDGLIVCHNCDNKLCVNPDHLFLGTYRDNTQDMLRKGRGRFWNEGKTHCIHGHEFTPENTWFSAAGKRQCLECTRIRKRRARQRHLDEPTQPRPAA